MITFFIHYDTSWGEQVKLSFSGKLYDMQYLPGGIWKAGMDRRALRPGKEYRYVLTDSQGNIIRREWRGRYHCVPSEAPALTVYDRWMDRPEDSALWSSAFTESIFRRDGRKADSAKGNIVLRVPCAAVPSGCTLALVEGPEWDRALPLSDAHFPWWSITLKTGVRTEYKYVLVGEDGKIVLWEEGPNRVLADVPAKGCVSIQERAPYFALPAWKGAGVAVPVFSLRSADSFGVGEFHDLKRLVDWAASVGMSVIQLLPVNDTSMTGTWQDSYPYNAVSSFALHPQFLYLPDAGVRVDKSYIERRDSLNALPQVDYEAVNRSKHELLRKAYNSFHSSEEFDAFIRDNASWLKPYAVFCTLRDRFGTAMFQSWPEYSGYSPAAVGKVWNESPDDVLYWCWLQWQLDRQLRDAVDYAHGRGVILKGDLPIGVSRTSADAWSRPELFNMNSSAGAPPDAFSTDGQNWGFPTYDWEAMKRDGFAWWKARLRKMALYFDAYRIDHILGFFRIWEIPLHYRSGLMGHFSPALPYSGEMLRSLGFDVPCKSGAFEEDLLFIEDPLVSDHYHPRISGFKTPSFDALPEHLKNEYRRLHDDFFYRRHNEFWKGKAYEKLPALMHCTGMLSCGEDLGMIPASVPQTMQDLGILSLEIQRMPKDENRLWADTASYPYNCVCATGTHDTSTLREWWEEDREMTCRFWREVLGESGEVPYYCEPYVARKIIDAHLHSPAMLCILPLQDWLALDGNLRYSGSPADERINIPAIPRHYWRYRLHLKIEDLIAAAGFNSVLREMISASGRHR